MAPFYQSGVISNTPSRIGGPAGASPASGLFFKPKMSFANIFGAPRTGVHAYRIFDVAVVDFGLTVAAAYPLSRYLGQPFLSTAVLLVLVSVPVHVAFGVNTKFTSLIYI